jgi:hypothetical protein
VGLAWSAPSAPKAQEWAAASCVGWHHQVWCHAAVLRYCYHRPEAELPLAQLSSARVQGQRHRLAPAAERILREHGAGKPVFIIDGVPAQRAKGTLAFLHRRDRVPA